MKNNFVHNADGTTTIIVKRYGRPFPVLIDTKSFDKANSYKNTWFIEWSNNAKTHYVFGNIKIKRQKKKIYLHRLLMNASEGVVIDHINHCGTDNRLSNLRECTIAENGLNRRDATKTLGNPGELTGFFLKPSKRGDKIYWGGAYINGVYLGRFEDYAEGMLVLYIATEIMNNVTDQAILERLVQIGHMEQDIVERISHIRTTINKPNYITLVDV